MYQSFDTKGTRLLEQWDFQGSLPILLENKMMFDKMCMKFLFLENNTLLGSYFGLRS